MTSYPNRQSTAKPGGTQFKSGLDGPGLRRSNTSNEENLLRHDAKYASRDPAIKEALDEDDRIQPGHNPRSTREMDDTHAAAKRSLSREERLALASKKEATRESNDFMHRVHKVSELRDRLDHHHDPKIYKKATKNARTSGTADLFPDQLEVLKDKNIELKTNYRELEHQIKVISTTFKRKITLLKQERLVSQGGGKRSHFTKQAEDEFNTLLEENSRLQLEEQDLMDKVKKLNAKRKKELSQGKTLYSTVNQSSVDKPNKAEIESQRALIAMKHTLEKSQSRLLKMTKDIEGAKRLQGGHIDVHELQKERRQAELVLSSAQNRLDDIKANMGAKSDIFKQNKEYQDNVFESLKRIQDETSNLNTENKRLQTFSNQNQDIKNQIVAARQERDRLQKEFEGITKTPFFRDYSDQGLLSEHDKLQAKLDSTEKEIQQAKMNINAHHKTIDENARTEEQLRIEKDQWDNDMDKMRMHQDPSGITLSDVMKKLEREDPSRFRDVMKDLNYQGGDPSWMQLDYQEQLNQLTGKVPLEEDSMESLNKNRERLTREKADLATELGKIQKLLKIQVQIDKEQSSFQRTDLEQVKSKIKQLNESSSQISRSIQIKNEKLLTLQKERGPTGLTMADVQRFNQELSSLQRETRHLNGGGADDDQLSQFTAMSQESELADKENMIDLRITSASYDKNLLCQILNQTTLDLQPANVKTFLAVDFFNHDTKSTDVTHGTEPVFNTVFRFKNQVDNFYIKHLEKETATVDVFMIPKVSVGATNPSSAIKVGTSKLPLYRLLDKDYSFQAQEITHVNERGDELPVGKLFYRLVPCKPLTEAYKWFKQSMDLHQRREMNLGLVDKEADKLQDEESKERKYSVVTVTVKECRNLKVQGNELRPVGVEMKPFFTYEFFNFTHTSAVVPGRDPNFRNETKEFELENTVEFINYMKSQVLLIDFIDESVDITAPNARDYIGSARVSLKEVYSKKQLALKTTIVDEDGNETGLVSLEVKIRDVSKAYQEIDLELTRGDMTHKKIHENVIRKIAVAFAQTSFDDIDIFLSMLFAKNSHDTNKCSREQFEEFIFVDMQVQMPKNDLRIFMQTHDFLRNRSLFTRPDLRAIFERPFKDARNQLASHIAANQHDGGQSSRRLGHTHKRDQGFGQSMSPTKADNQNPFMTIKEQLDPDDSLSRASFNDTSRVGGAAAQGETRQTFGMPQNNNQLTINKGGANQAGLDTAIIDQVLQKRCYDAIGQFNDVCGQGVTKASQRQVEDVLTRMLKLEKYKENNHEILNWFNKYKMGTVVFFEETLMSKYGSQFKLLATKNRSPAVVGRLNALKKKLYQNLQHKDWSLKDMFAIMDANNDKCVDKTEFSKGLAGANFDRHEADELFKAIDIDNSGELTIEEINQELVNINVGQIVDRIFKHLETANMTVQDMFAAYDSDQNSQIKITEFAQMINQAVRKENKDELDLLFKFLDRSQKGFITVEDLTVIKNREEQILSSKALISYRDIFVPLRTVTREINNVQVNQLFEWFKKELPDKMTFKELITMIEFFMKGKLLEEEVIMLQSYINGFSKTNDGSLDRVLFEQLMITDYKKELDRTPASRQEAEKTLKRVGEIAKIRRIQIVSELEGKFMTKQELERKQISTRNFKHFLFNRISLGSIESDNLTDFLDKSKNGFIEVTAIQSAVDQAQGGGASRLR